jgi:hypothetical protein
MKYGSNNKTKKIGKKTIYTIIGISLVVVVLIAALVLASPFPYSFVKFAHFSPDSGTLQILENDTATFQNLQYQGITGYRQVSKGDYSFSITRSGTENVLLSSTEELRRGRLNTILILNTANNIEYIKIEDQSGSISPRKSEIRIINAIPDSSPINLENFEREAFFSNVEFKEVERYKGIQPGLYSYRLMMSGNPVLDIGRLEFVGGKSYTLYVSGTISNSDLSFVLKED